MSRGRVIVDNENYVRIFAAIIWQTSFLEALIFPFRSLLMKTNILWIFSSRFLRRQSFWSIKKELFVKRKFNLNLDLRFPKILSILLQNIVPFFGGVLIIKFTFPKEENTGSWAKCLKKRIPCQVKKFLSCWRNASSKLERKGVSFWDLLRVFLIRKEKNFFLFLFERKRRLTKRKITPETFSIRNFF